MTLENTKQSNMKYVFGAVVVFVVLSIVAGIYFAGSPTEQRKIRMDDIRISHLSGIQNNITEYWRAKQKLPDTLLDLNNDLLGIRVPLDPETNQSYEYDKKGDTTFVLCAVFAKKFDETNSSPNYAYPVYPYDGIKGGSPWKHDAGRVCFERSIDKDFFKATPLVQ